MAGLLGLPSTAGAQDNATCVVYPNLCPPQNNPNNPPGTTVTPGPTATTATPGQGVAEQPVESGGDRVGDGETGDRADTPGATTPGGAPGAQPARTRGPINVDLRRGPGAPGRCWYAIVHLDTERDDIERHVRRALGEPCYVATMRAPVDLEGLRKLLAGTSYAELGSEKDGLSVLSRLGRAVGGQLVTPESLIHDVEERIFSEVEREIVKVSGIVVTHDEHSLEGAEKRASDVLAKALVRGMREAQIPSTNGGEMPVPIVGTELTTTKPSWVPWFNARKISSVDNINQRVGKQALALLMSGGERGAYGVKDTAKALLPRPGAEAAPVRFRTAGAIGVPAEASSGIGLGTALIAALLALTSGWALGLAGRRTVRRRLSGARR